MGRFTKALLATSMLALAACATTSPERTASLPDVPHETTPQGERVVVVRDYVELQKRDHGELWRTLKKRPESVRSLPLP